MVASVCRIAVCLIGLIFIVPPTESLADELRIFTLEHADCGDMASLIQQLTDESPLNMASDRRTNSLIIVGEEELLSVIESLLQKLDRKVDRPERREVEVEIEVRERHEQEHAEARERHEIREREELEHREREELEQREREELEHREREEKERGKHRKLENKEREIRHRTLEHKISLLSRKLKMIEAKAEVDKMKGEYQIDAESNSVAKKLMRLQLDFHLKHEVPFQRLEVEHQIAVAKAELEMFAAQKELHAAAAPKLEPEPEVLGPDDVPPEDGMVWNEEGEYWEFDSEGGFADDYDGDSGYEATEASS